MERFFGPVDAVQLDVFEAGGSPASLKFVYIPFPGSQSVFAAYLPAVDCTPYPVALGPVCRDAHDDFMFVTGFAEDRG